MSLRICAAKHDFEPDAIGVLVERRNVVMRRGRARRPDADLHRPIEVVGVRISAEGLVALEEAKRPHDTVVERLRPSEVGDGEVDVVEADDLHDGASVARPGPPAKPLRVAGACSAQGESFSVERRAGGVIMLMVE
jgi:hypothetical protein